MLPTNLMKMSTSWEAAGCAAILEISRILRKPECLLSRLQDPSPGPYPKPDQSSPYYPNVFVCMLQENGEAVPVTGHEGP
jgi:hypothetical protein